MKDDKFQFDTIESALAQIKYGRMVVVVDDENRENEGDLIGAAQFATPDMINFMAIYARGLICLAMTGDRLDELDIPLMVTNNTDINQTAFTVSIDASPHLGATTGISAEDRALTIQVALNPHTKPKDLRRPGHIFPLRAREGGVLKRAGHTEAAVDLAQLAGLYPAGVICEIQNLDGSMARLPQLIQYAHLHQLKIISIADLISYRLQHERFIKRETIADLPTLFGNFKIYAYQNTIDTREHLAIVKGDPAQFTQQPVMVRVHSECLTGDALGSLRCDCRMQLHSAMSMIEHEGLGVVVYLRQEGRGIGLINKLKAYTLQDLGLDTVEANQKLGFPPDLRNYGIGAQILCDLGIKQIRLITNNPRKIAGLKGYGLEIVERLPLLIQTNSYNSNYLATKAQKLGHLLLQTHLITIGIQWDTQLESIKQKYQKLDQLRNLVRKHDLLLQEEARPVAIALFSTQNPHPSALTVIHLGLDQNNMAPPDWYQNPEHPYVIAISRIIDEIAQFPAIERLEFLINNSLESSDPLIGLQSKLDRANYPLNLPPSNLCQQLQPQKIYSFTPEIFPHV